MSDIDYEQACDLHGVMKHAAIYNRGGRVKTGTLAACVRTVMEDWDALQRASAMILTSGPGYNYEAIKAIYARPDFSRG